MAKKGAIIIEGHVQGLANTRALGEVGIPVIVVDARPCVASASKFCMDFFISPPFLDDAFADFLLELGMEKQLEGWLLIPSNDHVVFTLSKHKDKLQQLFRFAIPSPKELDNIYDKVKLLDIAKELSIPIPITHCFQEVNEAIPRDMDFPLITKGKNGLSFYKTMGKKAFLAENESEFVEQRQEITEKYLLSSTFTQELIPFDGSNKTLSFTAFCVEGKVEAYWMGIKLREHPLQFGTATFTESVFVEDCLIQSCQLLKELQYTGICEVEYLQDPRNGQYKLIEINPRTWLWVGHAIASGINLPLYLYNYVNGIETEYPKDYPIGLKWKNPISDAVFKELSKFKFSNGFSPKEYLKGTYYYLFIRGIRKFFQKKYPPNFAYRSWFQFFVEEELDSIENSSLTESFFIKAAKTSGTNL